MTRRNFDFGWPLRWGFRRAALRARGRWQPEVTLAIGAIVRNEAPYLLEWIAYHRAVGIERFFIADNESDDGTTELLARLARETDFVVHIPFADVRKGAVQLAAYRHIVSTYGPTTRWLAFIDADEFLVPDAPLTSVRPILEGMAPKVGGIGVNWAIYGSSGAAKASDGLVLERFARRGKQAHPVNRHYKSIVRPEAVASTVRNPHAMRLRWGYAYVHADGSPLKLDAKRGSGLSAEIRWAPLKLAHFVTKSREEFARKAARGRASSKLAKPRDQEFFTAHDKNDVLDPVRAELVAEARRELSELADSRRGGA